MELIKNNIQFYDLNLDRTSVYEESTDAIVPDSHPDIARIAYATGTAVIKDESPQNDRVLVSGTVKTSVLYQPEGEEGLRRLNVPLSFAHIEECKGITADGVCFVRCQVIGVEAKAVNSRKVNVNVRLSFETNAYDRKEISLTESVDSKGSSLEVQYTSNTISVPEYILTRDFTVLEDIDMGISEGQELLHTRCNMRVTETRAMYGKVMIKGDAALSHQILLPDGSLTTTGHSVPFTQIFDFEGMEEGHELRVRFAVRNLDCELHSAGVLSVGIGVGVLVASEDTQVLTTVRDLYHTTHEMQVQAQPVHINSLMYNGELRSEANESVALGTRAAQIVDTHTVCYGVQQEDAGSIRLMATAKVVFLTEDGELASVNRALSILVSLPMQMDGGAVRDITLQSTGTPGGDDNVNLRIAVTGGLYSRVELMVNDITAVEIGEPIQKDGSAVTLVLRYVEQEEELWTLAKQYRTTTGAIRNANSLPQDTLTVREQKLLIPICEK